MKAKCEEVAALGLGPAPAYITEHPGFASVCLDVRVLQAVYNEYKQRYSHIDKPLFELVDHWYCLFDVFLCITNY